MDCDRVFMILTRGPFPTGESWDEEVEAHLESCGDCWRLAEALRPALEVFQEAVPPAEGRDLPGYWGDARPGPASPLGGMARAGGRTALAAKIRQVAPSHRRFEAAAVHSEFTLDIMRTIALAVMVAAASISLVMLFRA